MAPPSLQSLVKFGRFELNAEAGELREAGVLRDLPPQPFRVLVLLVSRAGETVTRADIHRCIWGERRYIDADRGINFCVNQIRTALRDPAARSQFIRTHPRRGYRFIADVERVTATSSAAPASIAGTAAQFPAAARRRRGFRVAAALLAAISLAAISGAERTARPSTWGPVLVAEITNATGDPVFDETLSEALKIELRQSPSIDLLPDARVLQTLKMMEQPGSRLVTPELGRELCLRTGSRVLVGGGVATIGQHYLLTVNAISCGSGDSLFSAQREVGSKEEVLVALSVSATQLRSRLGESLPSIAAFDVPLEATTNSLQALQSFTVGIRLAEAEGDALGIPLFQRALDLDPSFAMAYAALATSYNNLAQPSMALKYAAKAYEFRDRVTEPERLVIMSRYFRLRGELEKLTQVLTTWKSQYPRDARPYGSLGSSYIIMGQYTQALTEWQAAKRLRPDDVIAYDNLVAILLALDKPQEAQAVVDEALARHLDSSGFRWVSYELAFIDNDASQMRRQLQRAVGMPGTEDVLLSAQADSEAFFGKLRSSREFTRQAVNSAQRADYREAAALWEAEAALREAEFGAIHEAVDRAASALALDPGRNVKIIAALALARAGSIEKAAALASELETDEPQNTVMSVGRLPSIRAAIALHQGDPVKALELLQVGRSYELGKPSPVVLAPLYPLFLRGEAYMALHDIAASTAEYQKILSHPGIALNSPLGVLARLALARAYGASGDIMRARSTYRELLAIWKDADPDNPLRLAAQAEYAKAQTDAAPLMSAR